ncbi:MAG: DUF2244 domain-containing protein [Litoreibacter sp.]|nr:DUF2244 domain-containing protein [Litoreibacter sp.]
MLYPHRSMNAKGFVWVIALLAGGLAIPLFGVFGTAVLWGVLPFLVLTVSALWFFIMKNYKDGQIVEELSLWQDEITLVRVDPKGQRRDWCANPYWVRVAEHDEPVKHYLTLKGGEREVELGAFLSADERLDLKRDLEDRLRALSA